MFGVPREDSPGVDLGLAGHDCMNVNASSYLGIFREFYIPAEDKRTPGTILVPLKFTPKFSFVLGHDPVGVCAETSVAPRTAMPATAALSMCSMVVYFEGFSPQLE